MSSTVIPMSQRRRDWFFVAVLGLLALGSLSSDVPRALGWTSGNGADANAWYIRVAGDHFFATDPMPLRVRLYLSAFLFGPLAAYLAYAFFRGDARARPVGLLYAGAMIAGMVEFFAWEWASGTPPTHLAVFFAFNGPYLLVPLLVLARMWKPRPFGAAEG